MKQLFFYCFLLVNWQITYAQDTLSTELLDLDHEVLDSLSEAAYLKGNYADAIKYAEANLKKAAQTVGVKDSTYGAYINYLGFLNVYSGNYTVAEQLFLQGQIIFTNLFGHEHKDVADALSGLAKVYRRTGAFKKTEEVLLEVKTINAKLSGTESQAYAVTLNDLAVLYYYMGRYEEAELLYLENKKINAKISGGMNVEYSNTLANLAALYYVNEQLEEAEPLYLEAVGIAKKVYGEEHPRYANTLSNLAALYLKMGRNKEGEKLCLEVQAIREKVLGTKHPLYANNLNLLATSYKQQGRYDEAIKLSIRVREILRTTIGVNHPKYAIFLSNFASAYFKMEHYEDAEKLRLESLEIMERKVGTQHEGYVNCVNDLVDVYIRLDNLPKAKRYLHKCLQAASNSTISLVPTQEWRDSLMQADYLSINHLNQMLRGLERLYLLLEKEQAPDKEAKQLLVTSLAHDLFTKIRKLYTNSTSKLRVLERSERWNARGLYLLEQANLVEQAFDLAEANKSVLLLEATKAEKAYRLGNLPDSLMDRENELFKERDELQANIITKRPQVEQDSLRKLLNDVNQDIRFFVQQLEKDYPNYVQLKYKSDNATLREIQALLSPKTALLEYVVTDSVLYLFYIDKKEYKLVRQSLKREHLTTKIRDLYRALSNYDLLAKNQEKAYEAYTRPAHWFYKKMIAPILRETSDIEHLIIVPDGELAYLPFEVFLMNPAPQGEVNYPDLDYLIKHFKVSYNYSATLWKENKQSTKSVNNGQILAMAANYDISLDTLKKDLRLPNYYRGRKGLKPLYAARREVNVLSKEFQGYFGFDKDASERLFKEKVADYAVIHLAMHGVLDYKQPILSSLIFTEDGDSIENSFLQAYEIANLKLNADLVVLSACETGFGTFEKGNGIASLARSFMYAGASSMVMTLWQVNDFATAEMMKIFYSNLSNGMTKSEALREAKLNFMQNASGIGPHPAFWSPFLLVGNDEPIQIMRKSTWMYWGLGLVALGLAIVVAGRWWHR